MGILPSLCPVCAVGPGVYSVMLVLSNAEQYYRVNEKLSSTIGENALSVLETELILRFPS